MVIAISMVGALVASPAFTWFDMGHMTIAAAAYGGLKPEVKQKIAELLEQNPEYETWIAAIQDQRQALVIFVRAATWADDIKKRHDYSYGTV